MSDNANSAPPTDAVPDVLPSAAADVPKTIPHPDTLMKAITDRIHKAEAAAKTPAPEAKAEDKPDLKIPPKALKEIGRLQSQVRDLEAKLKGFGEDTAKDAESMRELRGLYGKGPDERLAVLAKLSGREGIDELADLVQLFYEREQKEKGEGGEQKPQPDAGTKALLDVVEGLKKELADLKAGRETQEKTKTDEEAKKADAQQAAFVSDYLTKNKDRFEISAREENRSEAVSLINAAAVAIMKRESIDAKTIPDQETAQKILEEAMAEVEAEYEKTGKRFAKSSPKPSWEFNFQPEQHVRRLSKPEVRVAPVTYSKNPDERFKQFVALAKEKADRGGYRNGT